LDWEIGKFLKDEKRLRLFDPYNICSELADVGKFPNSPNPKFQNKENEFNDKEK
jgi:hypothetical protein